MMSSCWTADGGGTIVATYNIAMMAVVVVIATTNESEYDSG